MKIIHNNQVLKKDYFIRHGDKETILYLHGLGCSKDGFQKATEVDELQAHTLVAFDLPGCGGSTYPEKISLSIDDLVEITDSVVSELRLGKFILIGHSMGGVISLLYAEKYCKNVKAFINVGGNFNSEDCFISNEVAEHSYLQFSGTIFQNIKQKLWETGNKGLRMYAETLEKKTSKKAFFDICSSLVQYSDDGELIRRFLRLNIPTIFIYGSENYALSYIPELRNKGCDVTEISGSNHFPNYDNPQEFYHVISNYIEGVLEKENGG